ncbi:MAG TPA: TetR/AcrR family transcriptional regulator [Acidimicrobiales bacterium]
MTTVAPKTRAPGRPSRTESERSLQRQRLLEQTMVAIRRHGPSVSVDEIAAEAGVSKPVIYAEFGDKAGIADAIALERAEQVERTLIEELAARHTLDTAIAVRLAVNALIGVVVDEPEIYAFIVRSVRAADTGLLDNALVRTLHARVGILTSLLAPQGDKALISAVTHGLFGFIFMAVESWQISRTPSQEELVDTIVTLVQHGFSTLGGPAVLDQKA